jgi:hypothetical protein
VCERCKCGVSDSDPGTDAGSESVTVTGGLARCHRNFYSYAACFSAAYKLLIHRHESRAVWVSLDLGLCGFL